MSSQLIRKTCQPFPISPDTPSIRQCMDDPSSARISSDKIDTKQELLYIENHREVHIFCKNNFFKSKTHRTLKKLTSSTNGKSFANYDAFRQSPLSSSFLKSYQFDSD